MRVRITRENKKPTQSPPHTQLDLGFNMKLTSTHRFGRLFFRRQGFGKHRLIPGILIGCLWQVPGISQAAFGVQVGAFASNNNATRLADRLKLAGYSATTFSSEKYPNELMLVVVGPYFNSTNAGVVRAQMASNGWNGFVCNYPAADSSNPDEFENTSGIHSNAGKETNQNTDGMHAQVSLDAASSNTAMPVSGTTHRIATNGTETLLSDALAQAPSTEEEMVIIKAAGSTEGKGILVIDPGDQDTISIEGTTIETDDEITPTNEGVQAIEAVPQDQQPWKNAFRYSTDRFTFGLDEARLEYGSLYKSDTTVDTSNYGHLVASAKWQPNPRWETQLSPRGDWYYQTGDPDVNEVKWDYGESFVRFRGDNYRVTAGTQKVIWGRIDELPPTDRISRIDFGRGVLDTLAERRRAMPVARFEGFHGSYKLDAVWIPDFRKAFLPDKDSVWYPVNRTNGTILGFKSDPVLQQLVKNGSISENAPSGDGGFGVRLSNTAERFDYALTIQHARQSLPYWQLNPQVRAALLAGATPDSAIASSSGATFQAKYPRTWVLGGDMGFEALDATWRFEAAWISDTPATRSDLEYDTVNSTNWAAGVQFYPGDTDVRVNLQFVGINLLDAPSLLDRKNIYNFNGSIFDEFGNNRWRANTRFFIGLDQKDVYINPEITFIGWEPQEIYLAWHYFSGNNDQTIGGFWEDSSLVTLGWRARF